MLTKPHFSTLCLLSLAIPLMGQASNIWLFSGTPSSLPLASAESTAGSAMQIASAMKTSPPPSCPDRCDAPKCDTPQPCCETKTVTKVVTICEDPCNPSHCRWDATLSAGLGYRHDRLSQRLSPQSNTGQQRMKFKYHDVDSVMGLLRFDARIGNLLFYAEGDYSPVVSGNLSARFNTDTAVGQNFHFKFKKLNGYEADAMASIGYRLPFMNGYRARAALIFQVGYRYSHQAYETEKQSQATAGSFISILQDQAVMHSEWFGPYLEGRFSFVYRDRFFFQPFYQYHFLDYRAQRKEAQMVFSYVAGSPPVPIDFLTKFLVEGDSATGQLGGIDLYYLPRPKHYRLGIKAAYLRFISDHETKTTTREKQVMLATNPPATTEGKLKFDTHSTWESFSIAAYAGYSF